MRQLLSALLLSILLVVPARADLLSGIANFEDGNFEVAHEQLLPLAEQGDARAQYVVGIIYLAGYVEPSSSDAALSWLSKAADQGYVQAQTELARMYRVGDGTDVDFTRMVYWYERAAEQGDVGAQLFLADSYAYGHGIEADPVRGYMWYEIALQYWGPLAVRARDILAEKMTAEDVAKAQHLAAEWMATNGQLNVQSN